MRAAALIYIAIVVLSVVAGSWFGANSVVRWFERSTEATLADALEAGGLDWAKVKADGLAVILTGTAPSESTRARAFEAAARLVDTSRIAQRTTVQATNDETRPEFQLEILRSGSELSLIGVLPGSRARVTVLRGFGDLASNDNVTDLMEAVDFREPRGWDETLQFGIDAAHDLAQSRIVVRPGMVSVEAFLPSPQDISTAEQKLRNALPERTELTLDLIAPKPVMSPFSFAATNAAGTLDVTACGAADEEGLILIENVLTDAGVAAPACAVALGAPSPRWSDAVVALVEALDEIGSGKAAISDTDVVLEGFEAVPLDSFDATAATLTKALPPIFSLRLVPPPQTLTTSAPPPPPPSFSATLGEDGLLEMTGLVGDTVALEALENYAASHFGSVSVRSDLKADPRVPSGWSPRIFAALDALARTQEATLSMSPGRISIEGRTYDTGFAEAFVQIAATQLSGFETDVTMAVEPAPALRPVGPAAEACELQLAKILAEGQIDFTPASAEISQASEPTIEAIASVVQSCPNARFEIGGHTDSQGGEVMNQTLSQARADALRDGLISKGIFPGLLTAKGYGETVPVADNETEEGRAKNRRIEFRLLKAASDTAAPGPGTNAVQAATELNGDPSQAGPQAPLDPAQTEESADAPGTDAAAQTPLAGDAPDASDPEPTEDEAAPTARQMRAPPTRPQVRTPSLQRRAPPARQVAEPAGDTAQ